MILFYNISSFCHARYGECMNEDDYEGPNCPFFDGEDCILKRPIKDWDIPMVAEICKQERLL